MTVEFAERMTSILDARNISKAEAGYLAEVSSSHMIRVTHNDRGLAPDKAVNFMINARIPAPEQAMFLLQAAGAPEKLAASWLGSFGLDIGPTEPLEKYTIHSVLRKHAPTKADLKNLAVKIGTSYSVLWKHWKENTTRKSMDLSLRLSTTNSIAVGEAQRAQFFLTAAGFDREVIKTVLENYINPPQPEQALTPEQEEIMALGYKPDSIAVRWNIDPTAQTTLR